jgi:hypothetical protein
LPRRTGEAGSAGGRRERDLKPGGEQLGALVVLPKAERHEGGECNQHTAQCGTPPRPFSKESPALYVGYFENPFGEPWIFTFDRTTREARLRGGDVDWATMHIVWDGRVDGMILGLD